MSNVVIRAEGLGKRYRLGQRQAAYRTLRESLAAIPGRLTGRGAAGGGNRDEWIWALRDFDFEVREGEVVGVIGRNGAGKTTLLKVISRITEPSAGRVLVHGKVGSLLEVGTGFHPELTGRENIYLSGAILGMGKAEIDRKYDEIVDFAEVERFLDTPVKRYSSGMYVRLAFGVAAHLDPGILLVDEVLAVGDATFQKKCLGKMEAASRGGRTVLFVSHNMGFITGLATRGVLIEEGRVSRQGPIDDVVRSYLAGSVTGQSSTELAKHPNRLPNMRPVLSRAVIRRGDGTASTEFFQSDDIILEIDYQSGDGPTVNAAAFILHSATGVRVGGYNTYMASAPPYRIPAEGRIRFTIPAGQFTPGTYIVTLSMASHPGGLEDKVENAISFSISPSDIYGTGYLLTADDGVSALRASAVVMAAQGGESPGKGRP